MAPIAYSTELQIAAGFNNAAGLTLITSIVDADSIPYVLPLPFAGANGGLRRPRLSRRVGYQQQLYAQWTFQFITLKGLYKLDQDYQQTNSSQVTVRTVNLAGTFTNYNAYIVVPVQWQQLALAENGLGRVIPGNYDANWLSDVIVGFNIVGTAS